MRVIELQDDNYCFVCGKNNQCGLRLSFSYKDGKITSHFSPLKIYQGYKDIIHGGIIAAVLDESMIQVALKENIIPLTAEITIRFKQPLYANEETVIEAEILDKKPKLIKAHSILFKKSDRTVIAEASAKLVPVARDQND
jgi:acyl-coenzyme A thioesterase PaaI-like protein